MKGLSPLIAEVLLIAFVIGVGAIVVTWVTGFTKSSTKMVGEQSSSQIQCASGSIRFLSTPPLTYNKTSGNLTGAIENSGNTALGNLRIQILYDNATLQQISLSPSELSPGEVTSFNVKISPNYQIIRIVTNCTSPEVSDKVEASQVVSTN